MSEAGWAGLLTAIHDLLFACDRETRFTLAGKDRRLSLIVRAGSVTVEIPPYDPARLTTLGWKAPEHGRDDWFYEVPRSVEHVDWLCRFAVHSASMLISPDPDTITFYEAGPYLGEDDRPADDRPADDRPTPAPTLTVVPDPVEPEPLIPAQPVAVPELPRPAVPVLTPEEELAALRAVLTEAVAERDLSGYLAALRTAAVCMPLLEDPSPETGVRPAVVRGADNAIFLPIFTSADGLTEFAGNGVPFIAISFNDLIDDWPEPDWGVIIDPRTDRALTLTAGSLLELRAANPPDEQFAAAAG
ncbi:SseB family protein [Catenuloplanes japonicus]|uniref:SseB family protein n=1 Tax=Catenuloplanes japonicus TaxID=33876 RepID=UPI000526EDD1|nr:SseB family protein [Catenuloplanes japonicus]